MELLAWLAERERTYAETIDAWQTTCPRLSAWEDALAEGLVEVAPDRTVTLTERGRRALR